MACHARLCLPPCVSNPSLIAAPLERGPTLEGGHCESATVTRICHRRLCLALLDAVCKVRRQAVGKVQYFCLAFAGLYLCDRSRETWRMHVDPGGSSALRLHCCRSCVLVYFPRLSASPPTG